MDGLASAGVVVVSGTSLVGIGLGGETTVACPVFLTGRDEVMYTRPVNAGQGKPVGAGAVAWPERDPVREGFSRARREASLLRRLQRHEARLDGSHRSGG